jgi:hypothetical protein
MTSEEFAARHEQLGKRVGGIGEVLASDGKEQAALAERVERLEAPRAPGGHPLVRHWKTGTRATDAYLPSQLAAISSPSP